MAKDFASEVAKYPKSSPKPQNSPKYCEPIVSLCIMTYSI